MVAERLSQLKGRGRAGAGEHRPTMLRVRWAPALLWLLVAAGPVTAGAVAFHVTALGQRVDALYAAPDIEPSDESVAASGFGELFVASLLTTDADTSKSLSGIAIPPAGDTEGGGWVASREVSLGADEIAPGYFAVMVAADIHRANPNTPTGWDPATTYIYTLGVVRHDAGWSATGLPTLVAGPPTSPLADIQVDRLDGLDEVPGIEDAVAAFLAAYLTGTGDLDRYIVPDSRLVPVEPAPFDNVELIEAGMTKSANGARYVSALVSGTDLYGSGQLLEYALLVSQRDGRWEIAELLPAPALQTYQRQPEGEPSG